MGERNQLRMSVPETYAEELWHLQGKVEALEGYLRWATSESYTGDGTVRIRAIAKIMGINLTEEGDK